MDIAGVKTANDWYELKPRLLFQPLDDQAWSQGIEFYDLRMKTRYLNPINAIRSHKHANSLKGEGFAICTLVCSMIEAIETFYQGKTFSLNPDVARYEYGPRNSRAIFTSFLTLRSPFNEYFDEDLADDFYSNVRCSLLHEACTRNEWRINMHGHKTITKDGSSKLINRSLLVSDLERNMEEYKKLLVSDNDDYREAFIRKFDGICRNSMNQRYVT